MIFIPWCVRAAELPVHVKFMLCFPPAPEIFPTRNFTFNWMPNTRKMNMNHAEIPRNFSRDPHICDASPQIHSEMPNKFRQLNSQKPNASLRSIKIPFSEVDPHLPFQQSLSEDTRFLSAFMSHEANLLPNDDDFPICLLTMPTNHQGPRLMLNTINFLI